MGIVGRTGRMLVDEKPSLLMARTNAQNFRALCRQASLGELHDVARLLQANVEQRILQHRSFAYPMRFIAPALAAELVHRRTADPGLLRRLSPGEGERWNSDLASGYIEFLVRCLENRLSLEAARR